MALGGLLGGKKGASSPAAAEYDSTSPRDEKAVYDYESQGAAGGGRRMSRIDAPRSGSIVSASGGPEDGEASVSIGKQKELEADNAIKYRTCSWQKVRSSFLRSPPDFLLQPASASVVSGARKPNVTFVRKMESSLNCKTDVSDAIQ